MQPGVVDGAELPAPHQFGALYKLLPVPLLEPDLRDPLVAGDGVDHLPAHLDLVGQRLLAIDVLAGRAGIDEHGAVPVVRRGDQDRVDILALEQLPVVHEGDDVAADLFGDLLEVGPVDVAHGDHGAVGIASQNALHVGAARSGADDAHLNPVVGAHGRARDRRRHRGTDEK
jgi:hypothetical protein